MDKTPDSGKSPASSTKETEPLSSQKEQESVESSPSKDSGESHGKELDKMQGSSEKASEKEISESTSRETKAESDIVESKTDSSVKTTTKTKMSDDPAEVSRAKKHKTVHSASDKNVEQTPTVPADQSSLPVSDSSKVPESEKKLISHLSSDENDQAKSQTLPTDKDSTNDSTSGRMDIDGKETGSDSEDVEIRIAPSFTAESLYPESLSFSPSIYLNELKDEPSVSNPVPENIVDQAETLNSPSDETTKRDDTNTDPQHSGTSEGAAQDSASEKMEVEEKQESSDSNIDGISGEFVVSFSPDCLFPSAEAAFSPPIYMNEGQNESSVSASTSAGNSENNREAAPHSSGEENAGESSTKADLKRKRSTSSEEE